MDKSKRILIIDFCNYEDYPIGGYLTFAKNMMMSFGNDLALVGISTDKNDPIGKWFKKSLDGIVYDYFAFAYFSKLTTKHIIPDRLASYLLVKFYKKQILKLNISNIFIQRPEVLIGVKHFNFSNICYCFAGLENPLSISKYGYAHHLATYFEKIFFNSLNKLQVILASGDESAIQDMILRSNGLIKRETVTQFPSRINTDVFKPIKKSEARLILDVPASTSMIVTTGRLGRLKGWKFMIDCFCLYEKQKSGSLFYFIGEGEDLLKIEEYIVELGLQGLIILAGKKNAKEVALYLNASDLFIMGSYKEGWSTSLIEAIACGIPACVTNFSSAKEIIIEGKNGYVIDEHNTELFVAGMIKAFNLNRPVFNDNVLAYSTDKIKDDLLKTWKLI